MKKTETLTHTFKVAFLLCLICSIGVAMAAVLLRPMQTANKEREKKKNILIAAGLFDEKTGSMVETGGLTSDTPINDVFEKPEGGGRLWIDTKIINLDTGEVIGEETRQEIAAKFGKPKEGQPLDAKYDHRKASRDPNKKWSVPVPAGEDFASIKRRENYAPVYEVRAADGKLQQVILPIRGYGLWSTLWGFIALDADLVTIRGITYYEHGETPGLGGEVDNTDWKQQWKGKKAFDPKGKVAIRVIKGKAPADAEHEIDGLSGATITSQGVTKMMQFWLGENGFGKYLDRLRKQNSAANNKSNGD